MMPTTAGEITITAAGATDIGLGREKNEDFFSFDEQRGIFIVADGLGGHAGGEVASRLAVTRLQATFERRYDKDRFDSLSDGNINRAVNAVHRALRCKSARAPELRGMGTTVVLALRQTPAQMWIANVGDSRAYLLRKGELRQLSKDHSLVAEYLGSGIISPHEAELYFSRNVVTQALGVELTEGPFITQVEAAAGDVFLLCSDGLWDAVTSEDIRTVLIAEPGPAMMCRSLIDAAKRNGGEDNITALAISVEGE